MKPETLVDERGIRRCAWAGTDALYVRYHDREWGVPVRDDVRLFEKICLEGFQAGLSWLTILKKRENFRAAFAGFELEAVAGFGARDVKRLLNDAGIVRHRGKIESTLNNARRALELADEFGSLAAYFWSHEPEPRANPDVVLARTDASAALSKDLKRRGWTFVGPTTVYAFMQAMGLVNDHFRACDTRAKVAARRERFRRPRVR